MSLLSPLHLARRLSGRSSSVRMQRIFRGEAAMARKRHALFWGMAGLLVMLAVWPSPGRSDPEERPEAPRYTQSACFDLVSETGRMIAWARWEGRLTYEKVRNVAFEDGTPAWIVGRVNAWIADAYTWTATDEQISQWAAELGNTERLPHAAQLTSHESIAIWLRRIARGCGPEETVAAVGRI
ncbi:MAG: hypothetical protein U1F52_13680 [Burkholderiales bacterium]